MRTWVYEAKNRPRLHGVYEYMGKLIAGISERQGKVRETLEEYQMITACQTPLHAILQFEQVRKGVGKLEEEERFLF